MDLFNDQQLLVLERHKHHVGENHMLIKCARTFYNYLQFIDIPTLSMLPTSLTHGVIDVVVGAQTTDESEITKRCHLREVTF